jgi:hypothetical protein
MSNFVHFFLLLCLLVIRQRIRPSSRAAGTRICVLSDEVIVERQVSFLILRHRIDTDFRVQETVEKLTDDVCSLGYAHERLICL